MKNLRVAFIVFVAVTMTACASAVPIIDFYDADSKTLERFQRISKVSESSGLKNLGEVQGIYCNRTREQVDVNDELARPLALDQLKLKAAAKGADHISTPQCEVQDSMDFANNCFAKIVCSAFALKNEQ
jgi:hypothetical protein